MNAGNLWFLIKLLPLLGVTAVLFGYFGWWLRRKFHAPVVDSHKPAAVPDDLPARDRVKKLEHALTKSEAAQKALKHDLETLHAKTVSKAALDKATKELADVQHRLESDVKRIQALEADLKRRAMPSTPSIPTPPKPTRASASARSPWKTNFPKPARPWRFTNPAPTTP